MGWVGRVGVKSIEGVSGEGEINVCKEGGMGRGRGRGEAKRKKGREERDRERVGERRRARKQ